MNKICLTTLILLNALLVNPFTASAEDYQLMSAEQLTMGGLPSSCITFDPQKGKAVFKFEGNEVQYDWQVIRSIPDAGADYFIKTVVTSGNVTTATGSISIDARDARIDGAYNLIKKADYNKKEEGKLSGKVVPIKVTEPEISVIIRLNPLTGEEFGAIYKYKRAPAPAVTPPAALNPTISANLSVTTPQVKKDDVIKGKLAVDITGLPDDKGEVELSAYLTTYTAADAIDDFTSNAVRYMLDNEFGTYTHERVKFRTTQYLHQPAHNGTNTYIFEEAVPVRIPAGLSDGEYLLIVFARIKGTKIITTTRAGIDIKKHPAVVSLTAPATIEPKSAFQGDNFYLDLKYAVGGLIEDGERELYVRGNITGPEEFGVPQKTLTLGRWTDDGDKLMKGFGEITLASQDMTGDPGEYVWHYTIYGKQRKNADDNWQNFQPLEGEMKFTVKSGVSTGGSPADAVPAGQLRVSGLGDETFSMNTGSGWVKVKDGDMIPVGQFPNGIGIKTDWGRPTLEFPNGRKISVEMSTDLTIRGDQGDAALDRGSVIVYGPGGKSKTITSTPLADIKEDGTIFKVSHDPNRNVTIVEVKEGRVIVTPKNTKFPPITSNAGERLEVSPDQVGSIGSDSGGETKPKDVTGMIDRMSPEAGVLSSDKNFEDRVRRVFNTPQISDDVVYDGFAAMSLIIAKKGLPGSCYQNDPYVSYPTWDAHRKYIIERGRTNSANNLIWKTGGTLACLSNQSEKDALISDLSEVLRQAENGKVTKVTDLSTGVGNPNVLSADFAGIYRWDWANNSEPIDQGATATFRNDQTCFSSYGHQGTWKIENGVITIDWGGGNINELRATTDPNIFEGGSPTGARIRAFKKTPYNFGQVMIDASNIPGVWKWDWNKYGEPVDQGASVTFYPDGTATSSYAGFHGTWKVEGQKINLFWINVSQTNTMYSTSDPNILEGWGQYGERIRATKKESIASQNPKYEYGIDRQGWDYNKFPLPSPNPDLCASRCEQESQCRAWTYVKPGYQGPEPMCWLKNSVPPQTKGADFAISGVVRP